MLMLRRWTAFCAGSLSSSGRGWWSIVSSPGEEVAARPVTDGRTRNTGGVVADRMIDSAVYVNPSNASSVYMATIQAHARTHLAIDHLRRMSQQQPQCKAD